MQKGFNPWLKGPDRVVWWKKPEVENLPELFLKLKLIHSHSVTLLPHLSRKPVVSFGISVVLYQAAVFDWLVGNCMMPCWLLTFFFEIIFKAAKKKEKRKETIWRK
jgi:hypothetical protein